MAKLIGYTVQFCLSIGLTCSSDFSLQHYHILSFSLCFKDIVGFFILAISCSSHHYFDMELLSSHEFPEHSAERLQRVAGGELCDV